MSKLNFTVIEVKEDIPLYGLWTSSGDRSQAKDIPALSKEYYKITGRESGGVLPFFVLSKNYNQTTGSFALFVGSLPESSSLCKAVIPKGLYGRATVRPRLGFLWGPAIGAAKREFYAKWLPGSDYEALNMEYEHHTDASTGKHPHIDLFFAVKRRSGE